MALIAAIMSSDHGIAGYELDAIDVGFDRDRFERVATRDAVAIGVKRGGLILVNLHRLVNARVKGLLGQRTGGGFVLNEALADRLGLPGDRAVHLREAALTQIGVEFIVVLHPWHGRGPASLKVIHRVLHVGLLPTRRGHTRARIDRVMAHECRVAFVQPVGSTPKDLRGDCLGIVPPQFFRHATEKRQRLG